MKLPSLAVFALAALVSTGAAASAPTVVNIAADYGFTAYAGSAAVGQGDVNAASTLFYVDEKIADGWKAWYLFFDPGQSQDLLATLHFDQPIHAVLTTRAELDATNATFGAAGITYGTSRFIGLEPCPVGHAFCDAVAWTPGGHELTLDWSAIDPGDHIRVLVAVPEPRQALLLALGLSGIAATLAARRRRR